MTQIRFHIHPDGQVLVRAGDKAYRDTPANFAQDFGTPVPALPSGVIEYQYRADGLSAYFTEDTQLAADFDVQYAQAAVAALETLLAKQIERCAR